ncbi:MAG: TrmH family RNA methyltransferase [Acidimicrobiales bacterium]
MAVVEGRTLLSEALAAGLRIEAVYVHDGVAVDVPADVPVRTVRVGAFEGVVSTVSPQPVVAVVEVPHRQLADLVASTLVVVAAGVADPGNLGTIIRSAEAAGADAVVATAGSVDVWSPKVVRASAGAVFHLPVIDGVVVDDLAGLGLPLLGAVADGGVDHDLVPLTGPVAIVVGNEAHGLPAGLALDGLVTVRHVGRAESLNVAMAATVVLFEAARQRRRAGESPRPAASSPTRVARR